MQKLAALQAYLTDNQLDAAFITHPDNVFYFTGFRSNPHERLLGVFVPVQGESFLICPQMEVPDAKEFFSGTIVGHVDTENAWDKLVASFTIPVAKLAIEKSHMTVERMEFLESRIQGVAFSGIDEVITEMRLIKTEEELVHLREAAALADYAIEVGCSLLAEGKTEMDILSEVETAVKAKGADGMSFSTMVLSGLKTASPHGTPGNKKIEKGDFVLFDLGVIVNGYCSDITRTVAFGEPTAAQREIYETVKQAEEKAVALVRPGVLAKELDAAARDSIEAAGYGEYFTHRLGHGLGISVHEFPSIHGENDMELREGMVFTIEPGIYHPEVTGVRIEDDVVVTADGVEVLTKFTKELLVV
ncbi:Xaa-Pro peptidase family protein [Chryseomicrobium sp. FSL W7-1435]|uniref:M24 family metallopeptidase n=1 Tax=Chryseomicrobium sp. FSL W7-1435 TaxID=2921704 RepID=UPI00315AABB5